MDNYVQSITTELFEEQIMNLKQSKRYNDEEIARLRIRNDELNSKIAGLVYAKAQIEMERETRKDPGSLADVFEGRKSPHPPIPSNHSSSE